MGKKIGKRANMKHSGEGREQRGNHDKSPGIPMYEVWPEAREVAKESIAIAKASRQDPRYFGQCKPAY